MRKLSLFSLVLSLALFTSCGDDDSASNEPTGPTQTIAEIAAGDANFSTLVSALDRVGLTSVLNGSGSYTVFAPTNTAFQNAGIDLDQLTDDELTSVLLYHVIGGASIASTDLAEGQTYASTASTNGPNDAALSVLIEKGTGVTVNGSASVTMADLEATNGVIHVVDGVLLPLDVVGHAQANANFSSLVDALVTADLVSTLQGDGPFTVFAPVNSAFAAISDVVEGLTVAELSNVLTYHVVSGNVLSTDLSNNQSVTALNQGLFTVGLAPSVTITDANDNVVNIVLTDVQATNGVIHVLDAVLLP